MTLAQGLFGWLAALALRALGASWRVERSGSEPFGPGRVCVLVGWHQGLLVLAHQLRDRGLWVPVSRSRDGDWAESVLRALGYSASPRGSSSRGASELLRAMIRRVRAGESGGVMPDGPRGPALVAKPGVLALASATGVALAPVGVAAERSWRFGSWDRALCPRPFTRLHVHYGAPLDLPRSLDGPTLEAWRRRLEEELRRVDGEAERRLRARG
jgi:lysophospholipid acyltransferase (LPLAT)-like uncharacterized protein